MSEHESVQPSLAAMIAIRDKDWASYGAPTYQHYNWCLDYLESQLPRVVDPDPHVLPEGMTFDSIQNTMVAACTKYLKPRIFYDGPNGLWMCYSREFPNRTLYAITPEDAFEGWKEMISKKEVEPKKQEEVKNNNFIGYLMILFFIGCCVCLVGAGLERHNKINIEHMQHCENNSSKALFDSKGHFIICIKNEVIVK